MKLKSWILTLAVAAPFAATPAFADDPPRTDQGAQGAQVQNAQGEELKMSDLPAAVRTTVKKESKGKTIESIKKDVKDGKTVYDVELFTGPAGQTLQISEAGNVLTRHAMNGDDHGNDQQQNPKD